MTRPLSFTIADLAAHDPHAEIRGETGAIVRDVAYDSRRVSDGTLLFCAPGARFDGHAFAADAVAGGASGLVVERWVDVSVPQIRVPKVRAAMAIMGAAFFGNPSRSVAVAGVTGTNGKTTTSFLIERCLAALGLTTGLMGTIETHVAGRVLPVERTTPESIDLQRTLASMRDAGVQAAAMEVSSHGLTLGRVDATWFACGVFTNLTQDHLDFHGSMEDYFAAKAMLFAPERVGAAAVNAGDEYGARLIAQAKVPLTTFAVAGDADVVATDIKMGPGGSTFVCDGTAVQVRLPGPFNVANALAALAAMRAMGHSIAGAAAGIAEVDGVPGRFERIDAGQDFTVLVDYAHTPDSVERVLQAARQICSGRLTVVVGCGGDRDRTKRPLMGRAAVALADRAILTSDNPRSESPRAIIEEMERGAAQTGRGYEVEEDRRSAIRSAIAGASAGDVVVIAGKGHESGQEFAGRTIPFDDRVVAREEIEAAR